MVKNLPANAADTRYMGLIPGSRRSPGVGNGTLLQYSCWEIHGQRNLTGYSPRGHSQTWLSNCTCHFFFFFFFKTYCYCIFKRLQYNINITFTGTGKPQNLCDLLYCNSCFIVLVWNLTHNIYKVCLYHLFKYCSNPFSLFFHFSSSIFIPYYCISSILYPLFCIFCLSVPLDAEFRIIYPVLFPKYKIGIQ